jgi:glycosyltransferase involved in cell wall biosynthesis
MIFTFLKYIQPTWYFNLKNDNSLFVDIRKLKQKNFDLVKLDTNYSSEHAQISDAAYQLLQKGYISTGNEADVNPQDKSISLSDEYRFIRKYFNPIFSYYILFLRIISLNNPFKEIIAFRKNIKLRRINLYKNVFKYDITTFNSKLIDDQPLVSIIIPTLNRYKYLKDCLLDLEKQVYSNFEVIIVDQSDPFDADFYQQFKLEITLIRQEQKALWKARNHAVQVSKGEFVLLYDDDSRVESNWVLNHLKCLDFFNADISSGVSLSVVGSEIPETYNFFRWSDQLDTGNAMVRKEVFKKVGLFDQQFEKQRMGDGEFGLRAQVAGFKNISNPIAARVHLKVGSGGLRQMGSWDAFRPKKIFAPRPVPSVLYFYRKYFGDTAAILNVLKNIPPSIIPYQFKKNKYLLMIGSVFSIFITPIIILQVMRSWRLASLKLKQGAQIPKLR